MDTAVSRFGAAFTTLADNALSTSSFHHSGLASSAHPLFPRSKPKALAVALALIFELTEELSLASNHRCTASA